MKVIRCKGGCGKVKDTATVNKSPSPAGHTTTAPWTCPECAARIARRAGKNKPQPSTVEKKDVPFTLIPPKHIAQAKVPPAPIGAGPAANETKADTAASSTTEVKPAVAGA